MKRQFVGLPKNDEILSVDEISLNTKKRGLGKGFSLSDVREMTDGWGSASTSASPLNPMALANGRRGKKAANDDSDDEGEEQSEDEQSEEEADDSDEDGATEDESASGDEDDDEGEEDDDGGGSESEDEMEDDASVEPPAKKKKILPDKRISKNAGHRCFYTSILKMASSVSIFS